MTQLAYASCDCGECQRLDRLPVRLHGIPHAQQLNFLRGVVMDAPAPAWIEARPEADPPSSDDLPLFGGLEPDLFG